MQTPAGLALVALPHAMLLTCVSPEPGSVNVTEMFAAALPPEIPMGPAGPVTAVMVGAGVSRAWLEAVPVPPGYAEAVRHAAVMSRDLDYARYDFFWANGRLYGGEVTLYPQSGYAAANPYEAVVMETWDMRRSWFMTTELRGWRAAYRAALLRHLDRTGQ